MLLEEVSVRVCPRPQKPGHFRVGLTADRPPRFVGVSSIHRFRASLITVCRERCWSARTNHWIFQGGGTRPDPCDISGLVNFRYLWKSAGRTHSRARLSWWVHHHKAKSQLVSKFTRVMLDYVTPRH